MVGLFGGKLASKLKLPSVTGFILFGLLLGPSFTNIVGKEMIKSFSFVNDLALGILAISIGSQLHLKTLKKYGKDLLVVSLGDLATTFILVATGTYLLGMTIEISIVLGILAMTVSPSGVLSVIKEYKANNDFSQNVLTMVAFDNLFCILIFGIVTAVLQGISSAGANGTLIMLEVFRELLFAILLGIASGYGILYLIRRKTNNNKFLVFLISFILLNTGISYHFNLSALLTNMVTGGFIINLTTNRMILAKTLERIEMPIFVLFLTLAGAKLDLSIVSSVGIIGAMYIGGRLFGKIIGSYLFSGFTKLDKITRKNLGMALTPQAGVVIGLSIIAEQKLPSSDGLITGIVLTGVIFFEIVGPLLVGRALSNTKN